MSSCFLTLFVTLTPGSLIVYGPVHCDSNIFLMGAMTKSLFFLSGSRWEPNLILSDSSNQHSLPNTEKMTVRSYRAVSKPFIKLVKRSVSVNRQAVSFPFDAAVRIMSALDVQTILTQHLSHFLYPVLYTLFIRLYYA